VRGRTIEPKETAVTTSRVVPVHHINFGCRRSDLPKLETFYGGLFGFKVGYRPPFPSEGLWLYDGDHPLIHIVVRFPENWSGIDEKHSGYDHTAYHCVGVDMYRSRLKALGLEYEEQKVATNSYQVFTKDPVGNKVELIFPDETVVDGVVEGTLSSSQFGTRTKVPETA